MALEGNHIRIQTKGGHSYEIYEPADKPASVSEGVKALDTSEQDVKAGDFEQDFHTESGKIAIVDAAILDGIRNPLVKKAIVVPTRYDPAVFTVQGEFDDSILRSLCITPKEDMEGNIHKHDEVDGNDVVVKPPKKAPAEGVIGSPLSNDPQRKMRARLDPAGKAAGTVSGDRRANRTRKDNGGHKKTGGQAPVAQAVGRKGHQSAADGLQSARRSRRPKARKQAQKSRLKNLRSDIQQVHDFILDSIENGTVTVEDIAKIENRRLLSEIVNKMFYMCTSGWELTDGVLKHSLGVEADPNMWVVKEGRLFHADTGKSPNIDFDWAYKAKSAIKDFIIEENKNLDVDSIVEGIRNVGRSRTITG